jgi:hypothetical protein
MPGLLRGVVRTAAVVGTATAVNGRVARRQAARYGETTYQQAPVQEQAPPPQYAPPAPPPVDAAPDPIEQLTKLGQLRDSGVLTEEEFAQQKAKILG